MDPVPPAVALNATARVPHLYCKPTLPVQICGPTSKLMEKYGAELGQRAGHFQEHHKRDY
jgi:hypothetical protein